MQMMFYEKRFCGLVMNNTSIIIVLKTPAIKETV